MSIHKRSREGMSSSADLSSLGVRRWIAEKHEQLDGGGVTVKVLNSAKNKSRKPVLLGGGGG
jgi:hypothetical protein